MEKTGLKYGHRLSGCPVCGAVAFDYCSYSESGWGIVEQHGYCRRCGYSIEQAYGPAMECFIDTRKGFGHPVSGVYVPKDMRRHRRVRRKLGAEGIPVNPA